MTIGQIRDVVVLNLTQHPEQRPYTAAHSQGNLQAKEGNRGQVSKEREKESDRTAARVKCVPTDKDGCPEYDKDHPEACHCVGFIKDGKKWKAPEKDKDGWYDNDPDNPTRCFRVKGK